MFCRILLMTMVVSLIGCSSAGGDTIQQQSDTRVSQPSTQGANIQDDRIAFSIGDLALSASLPSDWEYYQTDYGIVLAEHIGSVATDGRLGGLLVHIFVPPMDDFNTIAATSNDNEAWAILNGIIESPDYIGSATVSDPVAFDWNGYEAAYYLMDNGEGNVSIVVGVILPQTQQLIACSISAPVEQSERIREALPQLLDRLTINDVVLSGETLRKLPDPLQFPAYEESNLLPQAAALQ